MKKFFTLIVLAFLGGTLWAASPGTTPGNPFQDELSRLDQEFAGISELEQLVEARNTSYTDLAAENNSLLNHVTSDKDISTTLLGAAAPSGDRLLGIPGFCWGFCLGLLGIILVYVALDGETRKSEGRQAILGCVIGSLVSLLLSIVYWYSFNGY
jgi:hypothetical protein